MKENTIALLLILFLTIAASAQNEKSKIREGNDLFEQGDFSLAEIEYRKALEAKPNYFKGNFNLGDALYQQENYEESGKLFGELAENNIDPEQKANAYYNLGNTLLKEKKYEESMAAYKEALRKNPKDENARYNLEYARQMLKQQQQQEQNKDQNQDKDQKDNKDKKDDQKKDQDKKDDQNKDQDKKDKKDQEEQNKDQKNQNKNQDKKDQQEQQQPQQISKQDAQRMLDALKNDEKSTLQKLQKEKAKAVRGRKSDIDW